MLKKGETTSAVGAATLIAVIVAFMLIYILLIPQEDREELLYGNESQRSGAVSGAGGNVLFSEFLGEMSPVKDVKNVTHDISSVNLFSTPKSDVITLSNAIVVSKSLFSTKSQNLMFSMVNPADVSSAQLYVLVGKLDGNLIVKLNGNIIYNNKLLDDTQEIIKLPLDYLKEENSLEISTSSPSFIFGENTNEVKYVKLKRDYSEKNRVADRVFAVPTNEMKYTEKAVMSYSVYCNLKESNLLKMYLNEYLIFSDVPFCNLRNEDIEIDGSYLKTGPNNLRFESEGDYIVEGINIKTVTQQERIPEYYFYIKEEDYKTVARGMKDVVVSFDFSVKDDKKVLELYVNENKIRIDTTKNYYDVTISDYIQVEDNIIRIEPKNTFNVVEFKIEVV